MEGEGERAGAKEEVEAEARVRKHVMKTRRIKRSMMIAMRMQVMAVMVGRLRK